MLTSRRTLVLAGLGILPAVWLWAQAPRASAPAAPANPFQVSPEERARLDQLAREDHADMMRQLGIARLRPGFNGWAKAGAPDELRPDSATDGAALRTSAPAAFERAGALRVHPLSGGGRQASRLALWRPGRCGGCATFSWIELSDGRAKEDRNLQRASKCPGRRKRAGALPAPPA